MKDKKAARIKRSTKTRQKIRLLNIFRLVVYRSARHIYAQIVSKDNKEILVSASTTEKIISSQLKQNGTGNKHASFVIGKMIADRSVNKGIIHVAFDRSGFKYHGRVKVLAETARQFGLKF